MTETTDTSTATENSALQDISEETTKAVGANRENLREDLARIQRNPDLSESARSRLSEEARREASARHAEIVADHEQATKDLLEANERRLFKLAYPASTSTPSEMKQFRSEYRECAFRVADMPEDALSRFLTRAHRQGDSALAQAVYHESVERGIFSVANEYRAHHPDAAATWDTYMKTRLSEEAHGSALTHALLATSNPAT